MSPSHLFGTLVRASAAALLVTALTATASPLLAPAQAATRTPPAPSGLPSALEPLAAYVPANSCDPTAKPGTKRLATLLTTTYPGTRYGISRVCGTGLPTSEHYDGRAVDWMNSVRVPEQAAQAKAVIAWLSATDARGNTYANARRLGVMYVIWNNKIWGLYNADQGWRAYSSCASHTEKSWDSTCHRDHMHISLSWAGAMGATSYWTKRVAGPDFGPCRPSDLNWAGLRSGVNPTPCPRYPKVTPPVGASANLKVLTTYSGMRLVPGATGPAVVAVQKALGVRSTGNYLSLTKAAVQRFQTAQGLSASGNMTTATWRALLKSQAPRTP